jgi:hypothetical protein
VSSGSLAFAQFATTGGTPSAVFIREAGRGPRVSQARRPRRPSGKVTSRQSAPMPAWTTGR